VQVSQYQCTDKNGDGQLAVFIYTNIENVICIGLVFKPSTAIRDNGSGEGLFTGLVNSTVVINTGGTYDLRNDNTLCTVDNESACGCHNREVTHEDVGLLNFTGKSVGEANRYLKGGCIVRIALLAFFNGVLRLLIKRVVNKLYEQIACVIRDGGNVFQHLHQTGLQEPTEGILLDLDQVGESDRLIDLRETHSRFFAHCNGFDH